jgi:hypothetical protein
VAHRSQKGSKEEQTTPRSKDEYRKNKTKEGTTQLNMKNKMQKPRTSEQNCTKTAHRPQEGSKEEQTTPRTKVEETTQFNI